MTVVEADEIIIPARTSPPALMDVLAMLLPMTWVLMVYEPAIFIPLPAMFEISLADTTTSLTVAVGPVELTMIPAPPSADTFDISLATTVTCSEFSTRMPLPPETPVIMFRNCSPQPGWSRAPRSGSPSPPWWSTCITPMPSVWSGWPC